MRVIELTKGYAAIVDDEDFDYLAQWRWTAIVGKHAVYAARKMIIGGKPKALLMHRAILNAPDGIEVDHINRDGIDNRRCNLRLVTKAQNRQNAKLRKDNSVGVKGVHFDKQHKKFRARIQANGKRIEIGLFKTAESAMAAYEQAARVYHGEFARLN